MGLRENNMVQRPGLKGDYWTGEDNWEEELKNFFNKLAAEQKDSPPEFEKTFRKHYKRLLTKS